MQHIVNLGPALGNGLTNIWKDRILQSKSEPTCTLIMQLSYTINLLRVHWISFFLLTAS